MESAKKKSEDFKGKIGCAVIGAPILWVIIGGIMTAVFDSTNAGMVVGTIITIGIVAYVFTKDAKEIKETKRIETTSKNEIKNILNNIQDFTIDDSYVTENNSGFIAVDEKNRKIIVGGSEKTTGKVNYEIIDAKSILGVEVTENGKGLLSSSANTNTLGMAAVGGLLFGGAGAIVGAISGSNTKSKITEISLRIAKDDIKTPYVGINFVPSLISKGSEENTKFLQVAERWYGILNILLDREKKAAQNKV